MRRGDPTNRSANEAQQRTMRQMRCRRVAFQGTSAQMRTTVVAGGNGQLTRFGVQGPKSSETFALPTKPELIWPTVQAEKGDLS